MIFDITKQDNAILSVAQTLTAAQQAQARTNIGAGTYSKPSGGIPASDLASGVIPEKLVVTYTTDDFQTATCDKTLTEIFTAWQAKTPIDVYIVMSGYVIATMTTMEILFASGGYAMLFTVSDMANNDFRTTQLTHAFDGNDERITISQISTEPSNNTPNMDYENGDAGASSDFARADHRHPTDTSRSAKWKYKTLTLATSDWSASGNAYTCTKTVTGMTSTAIGVIEYSDYSYGITDAQGTNSLTFTASAVPSAAVTVYVAFVEGEEAV